MNIDRIFLVSLGLLESWQQVSGVSHSRFKLHPNSSGFPAR
jgi:hypothetical protein